jgi:hypothetical protein
LNLTGTNVVKCREITFYAFYYMLDAQLFLWPQLVHWLLSCILDA